MTTNYERIKAMSVDEMAEWLRMYTNCAFCNQNFGSVPCSNCKQNYERPYKNWLKKEVVNDR